MARFFSPDSKLYKFMSTLTDVLKLNMLWLLFSLPLVTSGAATIAAFTITLRMTEDNEGRIAHDFVREFKNNIKHGIPMSFITILSVWAVYLDFQIFRAAQSHEIVFLIIGIVSAYILGFSQLYVYPLLARYENTVTGCLKNSFHISMKYFIRSLFLVVIIAFEIVLILWNNTTLFVGFLIGPVSIMLTISGFAINIFHELEKIPGTVRDSDNNIIVDENEEE